MSQCEIHNWAIQPHLTVTLQFVLSIGLIIAAVVIMQQLDFLHSKNSGFQKENVVVVKALNIPDTKKLYSLFREDLATRPPIVNIASTDYGFGLHEGTSTEDYEYDGRTMTVFKFGVDPNFLRVLGMQLVAGRNFDVTTSADTLRSVIINETMMKTLGWTLDNAIGQHLKNMKSGDTASAPVATGVVKDVNFMSMDAEVEPQLFHQFPETQPYHFYVRIRPGDQAGGSGCSADGYRQSLEGSNARLSL